MKKILALSFLILNNAWATNLTCTQYIADHATGLQSWTADTVQFSDTRSNGAFLKFPRAARVTITFDNLGANNALAGNFIHYCYRRYTSGATKYCASGPTIKNNIRTTTATFDIENSTADDMLHEFYLSSSPTNITRASVVPIALSMETYDANITVEILNGSGANMNNIPTGGSRNMLRVHTKLFTSDSVSFPSTIDLGTLSVGNNLADVPVEAVVDTNSIGIKFTSNMTTGTPEGASLTVNNTLVQSGTAYKPPFRLGMYVRPTAQPGTYTSNVTASWTCP